MLAAQAPRKSPVDRPSIHADGSGNGVRSGDAEQSSEELPVETSRAPAVGSQTLSRGIRVLEILATAGTPLGVDDVAARLGVHRSVAYRLIRTLESHGLVGRTADGNLSLGLGLAALASGVEVDLRAIATPVLRSTAEALGLTCFLALRDGDEVVTVASAEPPRAVAVVAQRPGTRHAITRGATGRAILSLLDPAALAEVVVGVERGSPEGGQEASTLLQDIDSVRTRGWAETADEVISGLHAVAVPLELPDARVGAVASIVVGVGASVQVGAQGRAEELRVAALAIRKSLQKM